MIERTHFFGQIKLREYGYITDRLEQILLNKQGRMGKTAHPEPLGKARSENQPNLKLQSNQNQTQSRL